MMNRNVKVVLFGGLFNHDRYVPTIKANNRRRVHQSSAKSKTGRIESAGIDEPPGRPKKSS